MTPRLPVADIRLRGRQLEHGAAQCWYETTPTSRLVRQTVGLGLALRKVHRPQHAVSAVRFRMLVPASPLYG